MKVRIVYQKGADNAGWPIDVWVVETLEGMRVPLDDGKTSFLSAVEARAWARERHEIID